jgi:molecular chaperone GrpE (heat shock protein)
MAAVIGALRVDLGLNSAEFQAGLKKASAGLGNFAKLAGVGLAAVATAAAAAGTALGYAVKGAIDNADQMGELAQQVGVSVEALTSLGYAAKMSGSDTQTLADGLRKLSQNMLNVAQGSTGPVATAFNALGISVKNANGTLRSSDEVLVEVASKFAQFEDGATKTALAVQLFGRSGAQLIPFLNQGRDGIAALTAEADRLGITISSSTANAAGDFNDTLDRLTSTFRGVVNQVAGAVLPALNQLGAKLSDPQFAASARAIGLAIVEGLKLAVDAINTVMGALALLKQGMDALGIKNNGAGFQKFNSPEEATQILRDQLNAGDTQASQGDFYSGIFPPAGGGAQQLIQDVQASEDVLTELSTTLNDVGGGASAASAATSEFNATMQEGLAVYQATRTPAEAYAIEVERLNKLLQQGAIDQDTYNRAVAQAKTAFEEAESSGSNLASTLSSSLANVFSSVVDGSKSAVDAIGDLIKSLADMAIQQGFQMLFGNLLGGGSGFKIPGFANGTNFAPGGLALVGERGPELVNLPRGSQVIPNSQLREGGGGQVVVVIESGEMFEARVQEISGGVSAQAVKAYDSQMKPRFQGLLAQTRQSGPMGLRR